MTEKKNPIEAGGKEFRSFKVEKKYINADSRTVELAFASEIPYERYFGYEILNVTEQSMRLGRLRDGAPLLWNHDPDCQIGVVESVSIGADRVARAVVRFGKGEHADEVFQDVLDGIRQKVSFGYMVHEMVLESRTNDTDAYRVTDFEPFEISIVSIPADNTVGVGRSLESDTKSIETKKESNMNVETIAAPAAPVAPAVDVRAIENEVRAAEVKRMADLTAVGQKFAKFGGEDLARQYISEGKSVDALNSAILERAGTMKPVETGEIGMSERDLGKYSMLRVMHALANPTDIAAQRAASFEFECSSEAAKKMGRESRGITVPYDVLAAPMGAKRTLVSGTGSAGGHTVQTDLVAGSFIEILRNRLAVAQLGATTLNGLVGNIAIPRQNGAATAYWIGEDAAPSASQQSVDQVTMNPKTVAAYTDIGRKLMIQSSVDVENMVRSDLAKVLALEVDRVSFYGTGSASQPLGLKNTTGITTQSFASGSNPTFAEVVAMETKIAAQNADIGNMAYITNATIRGNMKSTPKVSAQPIYLWENNEVNGYRAFASNQIASGEVWFGNWSELLLGFWSGVDLTVDPYTGSNKGTVRINIFQDCDVAVRHPVSFCRGA